MNAYSYTELLKKATKSKATQNDLKNLWNWFEAFGGNSDWNGESNKLENGERLYFNGKTYKIQ